MYEIGKIYIWYGMKNDGEFLNGRETIVTGKPKLVRDPRTGETAMAQSTDTFVNAGRCTAAKPGQLRPKNPPSGEKLVRDMFQPKPVMEPA